MKLVLPNAIKQHLKSSNYFAEMMALKGKAFRDVKGRKTIRTQLGGNSYFIKQHFGVGWREIFKNLLSFKLPILSAITEVKAIQKLMDVGIATTPLVAYGVKGRNPASLQSFIITEDLGNIISLEDLSADWKTKPPSEKFKRKLVIAVAKIAKTLHKNAINHRDFYLCHLCLDCDLLEKNEIKLYLIDLHRVLIHKNVSASGNIKDMAALYFSSMDAGLTARDYLRFKRYYSMGLTGCTPAFWQSVARRANKLYKKFHSSKFQQRLAVEKSAIN